MPREHQHAVRPRRHGSTDRYTDAHEVARLTAEAMLRQAQELAKATERAERHRREQEAARRGARLCHESEQRARALGRGCP